MISAIRERLKISKRIEINTPSIHAAALGPLFTITDERRVRASEPLMFLRIRKQGQGVEIFTKITHTCGLPVLDAWCP